MGQPEPAVAAPQKAPAPQAPAERPDEVAALVTARLTGQPVKITGQTTPTSEFVAQPDGSIVSTVHAAPVRVLAGGKWAPVDLTLRRIGDSIAPVAHPVGLTISGARSAASGALATLGSGTGQISMGWSGKLPEPQLDGDRAVYAEVLPGIDLVVEATRAGFEQFIVVKSRDAVSRVAQISLPVTGKSLVSHRRDASGALVFTNKAGRTIATSPTPLMWDAQVAADGETPMRQAVVKSAVTKRLARAASSGRAAAEGGVNLKLTPDLAWINDPATRFPVTIDPQVNVGAAFDTYVTEGDTGDRSGVNNLQLGLMRSGEVLKKTRSFVAWQTAALRGKRITAATASFYNYYSTTCTPNSWEIWSTTAADSSTRWDRQPDWVAREATSTQTKGYSTDCGDGWVTIDAKSFFQRAAAGYAQRGNMGIRGTSEAHVNAYKQFRSGNAADNAQVPKATVSYVSLPSVGARSTVPATTCLTGSGRPFINTMTPTLRTTVNHGDGTKVKAWIDVWPADGSATVSYHETPMVAAGSVVSATVPAGRLAEGGTYKWRTSADDGAAYSADGRVEKSWSPWCEFTVDTTAPALSTISSTDYPEGQWAGGVGTAGKFTLGAAGATDVAAYEYGLDVNPPDLYANAPTLGESATVTITPATAGAHTLYVRSRDRAGNRSAVKAYGFFVGSAAITAPADGDLSAGFVAIQGNGDATANGVTYHWRRGDTDAWATVPAGDVTVAAGQTPVTWPLAVPAGGVAPKLNWNLAQTVNAAEAGPDPLDGPVQLRGVFVGPKGGTTNTVKLTLDRNRAWVANEDVGVGNVNLITGDLSVVQNDASVGASLTRTANTRRADDVDPMFGPGWSSSVSVTGADSNYTDLTVTGSLVQISLTDGATIGFTKKSSTSFEPQIGMEGMQLTYTAASDTFTVRDKGSIAVTFGRTTGTGPYVPTSASASGSGDKTTYSWETVSAGGATVVRPTLALNPAPTGVTCTAASLVRGCRATKFSYAATTTASGTSAAQWGDFTGRVKEISFTAWDPDASPTQMKTVVLKRYAYDSTGRLRSAWDPRLDWTESGQLRHLGATYTYGSDGVLTDLRPAGQEPWNLNYTAIPGDSAKGRLAQVSRGIGTEIARTTIVYAVPLSGAGAPYDLSSGQTNRWAQPEAPVAGTAIFPANQIPNGNQASGVLPSSYERASVTYLDANGRVVNAAEPGGFISSQSFDKWGNQTRTLDAANREKALNGSPSDNADAEAVIARGLSTKYIYSDDGSRLTGTLEPERDVTMPDGSAVRGRPYTTLVYDEGAPTAEDPYNLVTTESRMVRVWGSDGTFSDADKRVTRTSYDWSSAAPLTETIDPGGANLITRYTYDATTKMQTSVTGPGGSAAGDTPSTQRTIYYRAGTGSGNSECDNRPEFADLVCQTEPGGQSGATPAVPAKTMTYDMFGQTRQTKELTSAGVLRTTVTTYDRASRPVRQTVTTGAGLGEAVPTTQTVYDPATSQATRVQSLDAGGAVVAEVVRGFDSLGRMTSYKDADNIISTFAYDLLDRPTTTTDGLATRSYTYDGGAERRGLLTSVTDSQAGTYTAVYDQNGGIVTQQWPNNVAVQVEMNEADEAVSLTYSQTGCPSDDCTLFKEATTSSVHGETRTRSSSLSKQDLRYDVAGRLASVQDTADDNCVTRTFGYDNSTNRTETVSYDPAADGACQTATLADRVVRVYDKADRLTTSGYQYDALGRTKTLPAADSAVPGGGDSAISYYNTDMAQKIVQDDRSAVYKLDVTGDRYRSWTATRGTATTTKTHHYSGDGDSPSWTEEGDSTTTRPVSGVAGTVGSFGNRGLTTSIVNLHGDIVAAMTGSTPGLSYTSDYLEDGRLRNAADTGSRRYGWLGSEQRASDTPNGLSLMGVRLYNPATSRFMSVDPVRGGNANDYDYCSGDSVNCSDVSGAISCRFTKKYVSVRWNGTKVDVRRNCWIPNWQVRAVMVWGVFYAGLYGVLAAWVSPLIATGIGALVSLAFAVLGIVIGAITWFADKIYEDRCSKRWGIWVSQRVWKSRGWRNRGHLSYNIGCNK